MTATQRTTCPYCGVGCGILATPDGAGGPKSPAIRIILRLRQALRQRLGIGRDLVARRPIAASRDWRPPSELGSSARCRRAKHRDHSGRARPRGRRLLCLRPAPDRGYYVANKLMKGFIGSANIDTNSRLCMASSVAGHRRGFGADTVPGCYEDIELADLVVAVGSISPGAIRCFINGSRPRGRGAAANLS